MNLVQLALKDLDDDNIPSIIDRAEHELMFAGDHPFIVHKSGTAAMVLVNQYVDSKDDIDIQSAMIAIGRVQSRVFRLVDATSWGVHLLDKIEENSARAVWTVPGEVDEDETFRILKQTSIATMRSQFKRICRGVNFDVLETEVEEALWETWARINGWTWKELDKGLSPEQ